MVASYTRSMLTSARSHIGHSVEKDIGHLADLIKRHRLTPRALWYLQTDHDALVA